MKHVNHYSRMKIFIILIPVIFISCSKKENPETGPTGKLEMNIGMAIAANDVYNSLKAADKDSFKVVIYNSGNAIAASFDYACDMPSLIELPVGDYHAEAFSDNNKAAVFENPYYYGNSGSFTVSANTTTTVGITCLLSNIMLSVVYSDNVKRDFSDYSTSVSNSGGTLIFGKNETRAGYFDAGPLHIEANLYYTTGMGISKIRTITGSIANPLLQKHYEIHIDASVNEGSSMLNLYVDESYQTEIITLSGDTAGTIAYGDLIISEIMYNPKALSDAEGEWIELHNVSGKSLNLKNLVIRRGSNNSLHKIATDVILLPNKYAVLARTATATSKPDYLYGSSISLPNSGEEIIINTYGTNGIDGTVICSVNYGLSGFNVSLDGAALQLDPSITNADLAKIGTNWCGATVAYSTGDLGTPGGTNNACQ
jgi:hypothetical protein